MSNLRGNPATSPAIRGRSILPLPEEVVAQIKSSTAIVSLTSAVLELLKNSLDAEATKIEATVDFARGACTVEDNGLGIAPLEFRAEGGLGKLHYTSKHQAHEASLGCNGTSLASLSAVSLLSITSRHYQHRSHNSVTFHHAQTIERQLPASAHHDVNGKHGTRVTVRNLFGNLPVRVKQRCIVAAQKSETDRLWEALKTQVAGLLLGWAGTVSLRARNADNRIIFNFNTTDLRCTSRGWASSHLTTMLNILTQANYIAIDDWPSWVPVSASTPAITIKGAISLKPVPTKNVQFISLGFRSLSAEHEQNELYGHVNRLFELSSFGAIEEEDEADGLGNCRQYPDKWLRHEGYSVRKPTSRKGVDRYPMFHLRISLGEDPDMCVSGGRFGINETNVQAIVDVLGAMVAQWLSVYHFRAVQRCRKRDLGAETATVLNTSSKIVNLSRTDTLLQLSRSDNARSPLRKATSSTPGVVTREFKKRKAASFCSPAVLAGQLQNQAFAEWSRIKMAKTDILTHGSSLLRLGKVCTSTSSRRNDTDHVSRNLSNRSRLTTSAKFMLHPLAQETLNQRVPHYVEHEQVSQPEYQNSDDTHDDSILWTDLLTRKEHLLNARTGCVITDVLRGPSTQPLLPLPGTCRNEASVSLRLRPNSAAVSKMPWLEGVLETWDNPVFNTSEKRIEKVFLQGYATGQDFHMLGQDRCSGFTLDKAISGASSVYSIKLSKCALLGADVIAQVDKKFILVKLTSSMEVTTTGPASTSLLVLVDQHAADERIRAEALFQELCSPLPAGKTGLRYQSKLGYSALVASILLDKPIQFMVSQQERMHFIAHAENFAHWGILFDILAPNTSSNESHASAKEQHLVSVTALPPSISERCKSDAELLISFLRSTVWTYASDPHCTPHISSTREETSPNWVKRLATCPEGLIDMVNSRACRSAIMFNDELDLDQCKKLVQKLAKCVFPFMCAHGRPSMVPLVNIGLTEPFWQAPQAGRQNEKEGFAQVWRQWKRCASP